MPPKVKITETEIVQTALDLLRKSGEQTVNARSIAAALNCSTQPIFSNFATMEKLQEAVYIAARTLYYDFIKREVESGAYPQYKAFGMAYIRFAKEEKELFKCLFMCDRNGQDSTPTEDFDASVNIIMTVNGISYEAATLMHMEMWAFVHGIATMFATLFLELEWDVISNMMSDVYQGLRARHLSEVSK